MQRAIGSTFTVLFFMCLMAGWPWHWTGQDLWMFAKIVGTIAVALASLLSMVAVSQAADRIDDKTARRCLDVLMLVLFFAFLLSPLLLRA